MLRLSAVVCVAACYGAQPVMTVEVAGYAISSFVAGAGSQQEDFATARVGGTRPDLVIVGGHADKTDGVLRFRTGWDHKPAVDLIDGLAAEAEAAGAADPFFWIDACHSGLLPDKTFARHNLAARHAPRKNRTAAGCCSQI